MCIFYIEERNLSTPSHNPNIIALAQLTDTGDMIKLHSCALLPGLTLHSPSFPFSLQCPVCRSTATFTVGTTEPFSACWFGFFDTGTRAVKPAVVAFIV